MIIRQKDSFIVDFWAGIFGFLKCISLFQLMRFLFPVLRNSSFVEVWVLGHLLASLVALILVGHTGAGPLRYIILAYAFLRVFEIIVYQVNVLLFDEHRAKSKNIPYSVTSYRRLVLLLLHNYFEIIFWFAGAYLILAGQFSFDGAKRSLGEMIYTSFVIMANFGSPGIKARTVIGLYVLWAQSITGLFMTLLSLARFIGLLPTPRTMDEHETDKGSACDGKN